MDIIIWLVMGGIVGWLASLIMKTSDQQGIVLNVVVGVFGAIIGGALFGFLLGTAPMGQGFNIMSLVVALLGSVVLLAVINLYTRGKHRNINKL